MGSEYDVYEQGVFFTRDDFDPYKTILYIIKKIDYIHFDCDYVIS